MIPTKVNRDIHRSGAFDEQQMGVADGSLPFLFNILRNSTYNDPIGSPIREYVANALDEHVKHGKSHVPVEVTFPTAFSAELKVRDFGAGLSDEDVVKFFAFYGASDKRTSSDLMGAFGIGCKSAFAYTDSFSVVSYKDGTKTTFNLYIDETDIGKIARLASNKTDEPNGVEIIIPVKPQDVSTFVQRGLALVKYFKTKPLIKGVANVPDYNDEPIIKGDNWKYFGDNRTPIVIQGQVGYPFEPSKVGQVNYYGDTNAPIPAGYVARWEYDLMKSGLEFEAPIGAVEVTASRESLQMTPKSIKAIRAQLEIVRNSIVDLVSEKFKTAKTLVEAKTAYYNFFQKGGSYGNSLQTSIGMIRWNGLEIKDSTIKLGDDAKLMKYTKKYNGDIQLSVLDKIQCSDDLNLYYDDTDRKAFMYKRRAKTLLDAGASQVTVLQTDSPKDFKKETGIDTAKLAKYSTITPTVLVSTRTGTGIDPTKKAKHKVKVFELDWSKMKPHYLRGARSDFWKIADIVQDKQVYIPIDRFVPDGLFDNSIHKFRERLVELESLGVDIENTKIYGLKPKQDAGNMVRIDKWLEQEIAKIPNLAEDVALIRDIKNNWLYEFQIDPAKLPKDSLAQKYAELYQKAYKLAERDHQYDRIKQAKVQARLGAAALIKLDVPNEGKLVELETEFKEKYPLLTYLNTADQRRGPDHIVDYITLVDEARGKTVAAQAVAV